MYNAVYCDEFGIHLNLRGLEKWSEKVDERLAAIEENIKPEVTFDFDISKMRALGDGIGIINGSFVSEKLYGKLEEKHESDCRLISEYDLEIKKLEKRNAEQNDIVCDLYSNLCTEQKERIRCEAVIEDKKRQLAESEFHVKKLKEDEERLRDKYKRMDAVLKSRLFDLKNIENERDHYKGLYSSKCDDYDKLLEKQIKTEKEAGLNYKELFHSINHKHQKVVGEMKAWKERAVEAERNEDYLKRENGILSETLKTVTEDRDKLKSECYLAQEALKTTKEKLKETEEKFNDACILNKLREDVFEANIKLQKTIEAKDREIDLLRAELDKYKTGEDSDDRWID